MKRIVILIGATLVFALPAFSQQLWTGNAVGGSQSDFSQPGLVAASNSFPVGSQVDVTNPQTGQTVRVTIVSRVSDPGVFLLLGEDAANRLGVDRRYPIIVQASPATSVASAPSRSSADLPFSTDPDLNPAASLGDPNSFLYSSTSPVPTLPSVSSQTPTTIQGQPGTSTATGPGTTSPSSSTQVSGPAGAPSTVATGDPVELNTATGRVLAEENGTTGTQPAGPASGISSALQSFREPAVTNETFMSERLAAQAAAAERAAAERAAAERAAAEQAAAEQAAAIAAQQAAAGQAAQAEADRIAAERAAAERAAAERAAAEQAAAEQAAAIAAQQAAAGQAAQAEADRIAAERAAAERAAAERAAAEQAAAIAAQQAAQAATDGQASNDGLPQVTAPNSADPEADLRIARDPENPDTSLRPGQSPQQSTATATVGEPQIAGREQAESTETGAEPASTMSPVLVDGYAAPMLGDPVADALGQYASDFAGRPLDRTASGSIVEPAIAGALPAPGARVTAATPEPSVAQRSVDPSNPGRIPVQSAAAAGDLPIARFTGTEETFADLFARPTAPEQSAISTRVPEARAPELEGPSPSLATATPRSGIGAGLGTSVPGPGLPLREDQVDPAAAAIRAPESGAIAQSVPAPTAPGQAVLDPSLAATAPEEGRLIITLEPAEFRPPQSDSASPSLAGVQAPGQASPDAQLAQPSVDRTNGAVATVTQPETPGTQAPETVVTGPDPALGPAAVSSTTPDNVALGRPELRDPETLAAPNPASGAQVSGALTEPRVVRDSAADLMAYLEADPERLPDQVASHQPTVEDPVTTATGPVATTTGPTTGTEPATTTGPATSTPGTVNPASTGTAAATSQQTAPSLAGLPVVETLQQGSYYVQLGAFSNPENARTAISGINPGYPVAVQPVPGEGGKNVYRLFIGPLNEDEKGTALFWFRAKGYRDAFIRDGGTR